MPPKDRDRTLACHSCPRQHFHHTLRRLPAVTSWGVSDPFLVGCHWAASSGWVTARSFSPGAVTRLLHTGQPLPAVRDLTTACHSCPFLHTHHTMRWLPGSTLSEVNGAFFVGCHSFAKCGYRVARSGCQVGLAGDGQLPRAIGAPGPRAHPGVHGALPLMPLPAPPPDPAAAPATYCVRRQRQVFRGVPLIQ